MDNGRHLNTCGSISVILAVHGVIGERVGITLRLFRV